MVSVDRSSLRTLTHNIWTSVYQQFDAMSNVRTLCQHVLRTERVYVFCSTKWQVLVSVRVQCRGSNDALLYTCCAKQDISID
jgi:hypothetical protein